MPDGIPDHAPDPATIEEAERAGDPARPRGPHIHHTADPSDPTGGRKDATGRD